jgi:hypothetical protein
MGGGGSLVPQTRGSHTPIWCAGLAVTLKIDYYYYYLVSRHLWVLNQALNHAARLSRESFIKDCENEVVTVLFVGKSDNSICVLKHRATRTKANIFLKIG